VRIAINAIGEVGIRAGRILSAERDLSALGLYGDTSGIGQDRRIITITTLDGFDALVTDDREGASALAVLAAEDGLACAVPGQVSDEAAARIRASGTTLLTDCSLAGLAETLSIHESTLTDEPLEVVIAWTEPGKPLRRGAPAAFPDPVGARFGRRIGPTGRTTRVAAPVDGDWAGATATVVGKVAGETQTRIVGVADERPHLEALALAAGAVVAATTDRTGVIAPGDVADDYLIAVLGMGLGVAAYTMD
jgi:hypothetical protein